MMNYKQALYNAIEDSTSNAKENLNNYAIDFINDIYIGSQYICDAVTEFADNNTSIYYSDIEEFMSNNIDKVNDTISEFGWDGCGCDLHKAGQLAEFCSIEQEIYDDLEDIIKYIMLDFIDSTDDANDDAERIWESLTEERKTELLDDFICDLESIDNNSRLDDISDLYNDFVNIIIDTENE